MYTFSVTVNQHMIRQQDIRAPVHTKARFMAFQYDKQ